MYKIKSRGLATDRTEFPRYASEVWLGNWMAHFLSPLTLSYTSIESRAHGKPSRKAKLGRWLDRSNNLRITFKWTNEICKGVFFCVQPICIDRGFPIGARNDNRKGFFLEMGPSKKVLQCVCSPLLMQRCQIFYSRSTAMQVHAKSNGCLLVACCGCFPVFCHY